jgi:hypothetical protein
LRFHHFLELNGEIIGPRAAYDYQIAFLVMRLNPVCVANAGSAGPTDLNQSADKVVHRHKVFSRSPRQDPFIDFLPMRKNEQQIVFPEIEEFV